MAEIDYFDKVYEIARREYSAENALRVSTTICSLIIHLRGSDLYRKRLLKKLSNKSSGPMRITLDRVVNLLQGLPSIS